MTVRPVCALLSLSKPHVCAKRERSGKLQPCACASHTLAVQHQVKQRGTLHLIVFILGLAYACQHQSIAAEMLHMLVYVDGLRVAASIYPLGTTERIPLRFELAAVRVCSYSHNGKGLRWRHSWLPLDFISDLLQAPLPPACLPLGPPVFRA